MIKEVKNKIKLKQKWDSIFCSPDPFGIPFYDSLTTFLVFYPTEGYYLSKSQYFAITEAAKQFGDKGFWLSETEWHRGDFFTGQHWWCDFPSYEDYLRLSLPLENAMYSQCADWGLIISHEDHAIVGGTRQFIGEVKLRYPNWPSDLEDLDKFWSKNPDGGWVNKVINKIK